jgi:hypothetical protein
MPRLALAALVALGYFSPTTCAQPLEKQLEPPRFEYQTHVFRRLLFDRDFEPITDFEKFRNLTAEEKKETIIVILGDTTPLERLPRGALNLIQFVQQGGAVLLAADKPLREDVKNEIQALTGYKVQNHQLVCTNLKHCYQEKYSFCPLLETAAIASPNLLRNPAGGQNLKVATNLPSQLVPAPLAAPQHKSRLVAWLPAQCIEAQSSDILQINWRALPFGVAAELDGGGQVLFLADHSIFINQMMMPKDNNNVEFTDNCMQWLSGDGRRKKVLFLEEGFIQPSFKVEIREQSSFMPPATIAERQLLEKLDENIKYADPKLQEAENADWFNRVIHSFMAHGDHEGSPWPAIGFILVVLTLFGVVAGFLGLIFHGFQQQQPVGPSLARLVEQQAPDGSLMEQRNQGMVQVRNLWEVGRQLAKEAFEAAGIAAKIGDSLPQLTVRGGWIEQRKMRREVTRLWNLAFAPKPLRVTPSEWPELLRQLAKLRKGLGDGSVRLG